ncbi:MAG TPA: 50S ribosomal protein L29 [Oscillospiraceae bacterium]|nr:50S ribosomal protein L29 [Oscillospiraceae bacterium]
MKTTEIRDMTSAELSLKLDDLKKELFALRFQLAANQLENPTRIKAVKKDIARIKTIIREQELKSSAQ